jgi:hypothetical protein
MINVEKGEPEICGWVPLIGGNGGPASMVSEGVHQGIVRHSPKAKIKMPLRAAEWGATALHAASGSEHGSGEV